MHDDDDVYRCYPKNFSATCYRSRGRTESMYKAPLAAGFHGSFVISEHVEIRFQQVEMRSPMRDLGACRDA